jgi:hypothetical protein
MLIADESHYLKNALSRVFAPRLHYFPLPLQTHLLSWILPDCYPGKFLGRVSRNFATRWGGPHGVLNPTKRERDWLGLASPQRSPSSSSSFAPVWFLFSLSFRCLLRVALCLLRVALCPLRVASRALCPLRAFSLPSLVCVGGVGFHVLLIEPN